METLAGSLARRAGHNRFIMAHEDIMMARRTIQRLRAPFGALILSLLLTGSALAGDAPDGGSSPGFWSGVLEKLDLKAKPAEMPDFVQATRPDPSTLHFIPTGPSLHKAPIPLKSADEIAAAKAALDAAQAAQLKPGSAPDPAPTPVQPPKAKPKAGKSASAKPKPPAEAD